MNSVLKSAISDASKELGLEYSLVESVYKSYWLFIRQTLSTQDLDNLSKEELQAKAANFNIPYIGKLYANYNKYKYVQTKKYNYVTNKSY